MAITGIRILGAFVVCGLLLACGESTAPDADPPQTTAELHADDNAEPSAAVEVPPANQILGQELAYGEAGNMNLNGYLAMPAGATEPLPGVVMIHEWWGLNDNIRAMADRLAGEGFVVLAVDLYGGKSATAPDEAQALMSTLNGDLETAESNLRQAVEYLELYALAPKVGVMGWCLGGGFALSAGLWFGDQVDAVVMYYGRVEKDAEKLAELQAPLLGLFGGQDRGIPVEDVRAFRIALADLGKNAHIEVYPQADHAFANPSGRNYEATAAEDAWGKTLEFLAGQLSST